VGSRGKTPWSTLGALLYVDIRDNPQKTLFAKTDTRPKRFVLRSLSESQGQHAVDIPQPPAKLQRKAEYTERDLHPFLVYYGHHYLRAYLKTIHHSQSTKKEFSEWLHPDMVGCHFVFADWNESVVEVSSFMGNSAVRLFSFELKKELHFSNLREAFFQAVSNSSWANEGYLAAANISQDDDFKDELRRLSASFGIGVIRIDLADPDSTETIYPARSRDSVDWDTVNKLTINPGFTDFLKRIRNDVSSKEIRGEWYDRVLTREELLKSVAARIGDQ
jgi:hypothetical protein